VTLWYTEAQAHSKSSGSSWMLLSGFHAGVITSLVIGQSKLLVLLSLRLSFFPSQSKEPHHSSGRIYRKL